MNSFNQPTFIEQLLHGRLGLKAGDTAGDKAESVQ